MSRSWTDALQRRGAPRLSAGAVFGRDYVGTAVAASRRGQRALDRCDERALGFAAFCGEPAADAVSRWVEALEPLACTMAGAYLPLHVSVPDAAVRVAVFELDEIPKTDAERRELAQWLLSREPGGARASACGCQYLGRDRDRHLLAAAGFDPQWNDCLIDALRRAGLRPWSIAWNGARLFNLFRQRMEVGRHAGALATLGPDYWSLLLWDGSGRLRFVRSAWRHRDAEPMGDPMVDPMVDPMSDHDEIAAEIGRVVLAHAQAGAASGRSGPGIDRIFLFADPRDAAIENVLQRRLPLPLPLSLRLERLSIDASHIAIDPGGPDGVAPASGALSLSIAAALET